MFNEQDIWYLDAGLHVRRTFSELFLEYGTICLRRAYIDPELTDKEQVLDLLDKFYLQLKGSVQ